MAEALSTPVAQPRGESDEFRRSEPPSPNHFLRRRLYFFNLSPSKMKDAGRYEQTTWERSWKGTKVGGWRSSQSLVTTCFRKVSRKRLAHVTLLKFFKKKTQGRRFRQKARTMYRFTKFPVAYLRSEILTVWTAGQEEDLDRGTRWWGGVTSSSPLPSYEGPPPTWTVAKIYPVFSRIRRRLDTWLCDSCYPMRA